MSKLSVSTPSPRWLALDAWRGLAVLWMVVFHLCFDLNHWGLGFGQVWPRQNFYADPFWTWQRQAIVTLFMGVSGLALATRWPVGPGSAAPFWRSWRRVALCAVLVSAGSAWVFPASWISFGVLHAVALTHGLVGGVAMLAGARAVRWRSPGLWAVLAAALLTLPMWARHPVFDSRWTNWTGLVTRLPVTEDYVPLAPWAGVMLLGLAAGLWLRSRGLWGGGSSSLGVGARALAALGRHSLLVYMVHQPILIAIVLGLKRL